MIPPENLLIFAGVSFTVLSTSIGIVRFRAERRAHDLYSYYLAKVFGTRSMIAISFLYLLSSTLVLVSEGNLLSPMPFDAIGASLNLATLATSWSVGLYLFLFLIVRLKQLTDEDADYQTATAPPPPP
jgi:hypothetical protein